MDQMTTKARRIDELDLIRGFFVLTIVVDHLQRWPSPFLFITGEGRLWASAAEGFFIISGLLIGYIRGYKNRHQPFNSVAVKLFKRAAMLYVWSVLITIAVVALTEILPIKDASLIPKYPDGTAATSFWHFLGSVFTQDYVTDWIYFLRLYWMMMLAAIPVIWLLRRDKAWLVGLLSVGLYVLTELVFSEPEAALQWQVLFFLPAILGYYLEPLVAWLRQRPAIWRTSVITLVGSTAATMLLSFYWVHGWSLSLIVSHIDLDWYERVREWLDPWFASWPLAPGRVVLGLLWFMGGLAFFMWLRRPISKYFGWLLFTYGRASLSAYCIQAVLLCFVQAFVPLSTSPYYNFTLTVLILLAVWGLLKVEHVRKLLPT